jgi:hypothetical protein
MGTVPLPPTLTKWQYTVVWAPSPSFSAGRFWDAGTVVPQVCITKISVLRAPLYAVQTPDLEHSILFASSPQITNVAELPAGCLQAGGLFCVDLG